MRRYQTNNPHRKSKSNSTLSSLSDTYRKLSPYFNIGYVFAASVALLTFLGHYLDQRWGTNPWLTLIGAILGIFTGFYNFFRTVWGYKRSNKEFLSAILGGIIFRFLLIFILLFLLIKVFSVKQIGLLSSLCSSYILFLVLEVWQVHKGVIRENK